MTTETSAVRWARAASAGDPAAVAHQEIAGLRQCQTCGRVGREGIEVATQYHWTGGKGHELRTYCRDVPTCFRRLEEKEVAKT